MSDTKEKLKKILMAEDNSVNQMVAQKMIAKLGYRIDIVANGHEALDAVKKQNYDIETKYLPLPFPSMNINGLHS